MNCLVIGEKKAWFFSTPNDIEATKRASRILNADILPGEIMSFWDPDYGYWEPKPVDLEKAIEIQKKEISRGKCKVFILVSKESKIKQTAC